MEGNRLGRTQERKEGEDMRVDGVKKGYEEGKGWQ